MQPPPKRTKIVATVGPASRDPEMLRALFLAGVNVVRLNFSHGTHDEHAATIADVRRVARELGLHVAVLQDLPGPKVRTGTFAGGTGSVMLAPGATFTLCTDLVDGDAHQVSVSYPGLARDVEPGKRIYLADGAIALHIDAVDGGRITTTVETGGELREKQGINYPDGTLELDAVTDRDLEHLDFGIAQSVDWVAVSFVRTAQDVRCVQERIAEAQRTIPVIAKIEKHEALEHIDAILATADGIMVARGDLGIEIPLEDVPLTQKDLIARANRVSKPVITATQMLESMISSPRPTRAEATDVANAILDGTDAVMLSGETARGAYPLEAVRTMARIALHVEEHYPHLEMRARRISSESSVVETDAEIGMSIAESAVRAADTLGLRLIVSGSTTGNTARYVSSFRPRAKIVALTPLEDVARRMAVVWGVESSVVQSYRYIETLIEIAEARIVAEGHAAPGETIAITSGMPVGAGGTNVLKIHRLPVSP
ncbi:pyruvate kinase [Vulcanimicrobium alpinum]|uniref:Pyruvate kinase n=1 Tax=Vulcanimicrobium alpinum TaxID=3016050 RepID=A0AAN2CA74_UNVUL|nr:pyruvate kinase [Vulcanimicrobium alpinum]BDE07049.1 pyruvate kinase [Vulcanimicrobium alpinum]